MSAQLAPAERGFPSLQQLFQQGLGAPIVVMLMLAMLVVPLPTPALDALFTFNIASSLVVMLAVVYVKRPLDFTIFPTVLLLTTLMRLSLNVASTRIVLMNGHTGTHAAGDVIESFGAFVIGGNYAVGLIVFIILTIINFIVITKGATRISEVSARFILDSLPGKQMAIDSDMNAGMINREEAKIRRDEVREEADFHGSMDGASKFIRGDAIAGILILVVSVVGGLAIGMLQHDLDFKQAAENYVLLAIGDGLVAQLPALLISTAVAVLVTRVSRSQDMGGALFGQVFGQHRALGIAAGLIGLVGLVPGMPNLIFLSFAAILGFFAYRVYQKSQKEQQAKARTQTELGEQVPSAHADLSWDELRPVDSLGLEVGFKLIPMVDKTQGGELMARIKAVRRKLSQDLGFLVPAVHIRDNLDMAPGHYRILIHGVSVAEGDIYPDREMALNPGQVFGQLDGIKGKDPAFGLEAIWIQPAQRAHAESVGYTVVDAATVVATHLSHLIREHSAELLGHEETQQLLESLKRVSPKLVEDLTPKLMSMATVSRVLQNLLAERVPVRQIRQIVEALVEHGATTADPSSLTAAVRNAVGRFIVQEINGSNPELAVYTLAPALERILQDSVSGNATALEPGLAERLHQSLDDCVQRQQARGEPSVLLVPESVRSVLARLVRHSVPSLSVLAYSEVPEDKRVKLIGAIG